MSYKVSPALPVGGGGKRHEEAGKFKTKLGGAAGKKKIKELMEQSNVHGLTRAATENYKKYFDNELVAAWRSLFARCTPLSVGKSAYGNVYTLVVDAAVLDFLKLAAEKGTHRVRGSTPKIGEKIAVKTVKRRVDTRYASFLRENVAEATAHERMTTEESCFEIPCAPGVKNCASDHVPKFYFAYLADVSLYVTFMSMAGTTTLSSYLKSTSRKLDAKMYASIEKAVATLWASGFTHADLHSGNILVDPATKEAWIIDFGFAVRIPKTLRDLVRKRIGEIITRGGSKSIGEIWSEKDPSSDESLSSYTNKATQTRGVSGWYNPNGRAVLLHYNKMSADERAKFENVRKRLWGCRPAEYPLSGEESELEEGEIRPNRPNRPNPPPATKPPSAAKGPSAAKEGPFAACAEKCAKIGKFCNPKTLRCVKTKPKTANVANGYEACKRKCEAIGKTCNPKTLRCVKRKPGMSANSIHDACKDKCGDVGKICNPATLRCITVPGFGGSNEAGPAHGPATARNLSAIEKRLKRIPKGGLKKYLENKRAKCEAEGKKFNPSTGRCIKK